MGYMTTAEDQDKDEDFIGFPHMILVAIDYISRKGPNTPTFSPKQSSTQSANSPRF
jgi:hypothetical protein